MLFDLQDEYEKGNVVGLDVTTGEPCNPTMQGIYDNYIVKKQILHSAYVPDFIVNILSDVLIFHALVCARSIIRDIGAYDLGVHPANASFQSFRLLVPHVFIGTLSNM